MPADNNGGLNRALSMMDLAGTLDESCEKADVPPAKMPRTTSEVARALESKPPPLVGAQTAHLICIAAFLFLDEFVKGCPLYIAGFPF